MNLEMTARKTRHSPQAQKQGHGLEPVPVAFAVYAESGEQLRHAYYLAESIRTFAGRYSDAPLTLYVNAPVAEANEEVLAEFEQLEVDITFNTIPTDAAWYYFAGKVFAAAEAEEDADGKAQVLVWLDEDTIVLQQPDELVLPDGIAFAFRPVMHNRSGCLHGQPPDFFWSRIYTKLEVDESMLFPVTTPADRQKIRAYFNAGLLSVRPERGILRGWAEAFRCLYTDSELASMCREDVNKRIFLHQTALVGPVVRTLGRDEMFELSDAYNYPMFFKQMYGAEEEFDSLENVVTLRYDVYFRDPDPDWHRKLTGPPEVIKWLAGRLGKD